MKNKISRILGVVLTLALLSSLAVVTAPVAAQPGENVWDDIGMPTLYEDTDVGHMEITSNGVLFAALYDEYDISWSVVRSEDDGYTWVPTELDAFYLGGDLYSAAAITDIVASPNYANDEVVYVACYGGGVYRLGDAGDAMPILLKHPYANLNDTGSATELYDIDVWFDGEYNWIMAATDVDVLVLKDDPMFENWRDQDLSIFDEGNGAFNWVYEVAFAPDFAASSLIWAIMADDDTPEDFWVVSTINPGQWGWLVDAVEVSLVTDASPFVDLAFPDFYDSDDPLLYAALSGGWPADLNDNGNLYMIEASLFPGTTDATPLLADDYDIVSVEVSGETILAGATCYSTIFRSDNAGDTFDLIGYDAIAGEHEGKGPTGMGWTHVYMDITAGAFDTNDGVVYISTVDNGYGQSAVSKSEDGGVTYNQVGLIDDYLDPNSGEGIRDLAFSPPVGASQPALMITDNDDADYSLWRTVDIGAAKPVWVRVLCGDTGSFPWNVNFDAYFYSVEYAMDMSAIMLYGDDLTGSGEDIWKSTDNAQTFTHWRTLPSGVTSINDWVVYDAATIYCATNDGFYGTSRFGPATSELPGENLMSIALQPGFVSDDPDNSVVIVGNNNGDIFVSADAGDNWGDAQAVDDTVTGLGTAAEGDVFVAFDDDFANNGLIYFATSGPTTSSVIGQAVVDTVDLVLDDIEALADDDTDTAVGHFSGIVVAGDNALYAIGGETYEDDATPTADVEVSGTVNVFAPSIMSSGWFGLSADSVTVLSGSFIDGELLNVISSTLVVTGPIIPPPPVVWSGTAGDIIVEGQNSLATGVIHVSPYPTQVWWGVASVPTIGEVMMVVGSSIYADVIDTTPPATVTIAPQLYRLLLHEGDNVWETEALGDEDYSTTGLWLTSGSNILWTIVDTDDTDAGFDMPYALEDTVSGKVTGVSASGIGETKATVSWTEMIGALEYEVVWDSTEEFVDEAELMLTGLDDNTDYDVKVRVAVGEPFHSRWSDAYTFPTLETIAPPVAPFDLVPANGAINIPIDGPAFAWDPVSNADHYEFEISTSPDFSTILYNDYDLDESYLVLTTPLEYETDYYWRVRAVSSTGTKSVWRTSVFTTLAEAEPPIVVEPPPTPTIILPTPTVEVDIPDITLLPPAITVEPPDVTVDIPQPTITTVQPVIEMPEEVTPAYIWAIVGIGAVLVIAVIVLNIRTRRVV